MNLLLVTKGTGCKCSIDLARPKYYLPLTLLFFALCGAVAYGGYRVAELQLASRTGALPEQWASEMAEQRRAVDEAQRSAQENVNALALRLGQLQAHMIRLDAFGKRLVKISDLGDGEFDFDHAPAQGGPTQPDGSANLSVPDFLATLDEIAGKLVDRERQLSLLSTYLMHRNLQDEVLPAGRLVEHGYISSYFGRRVDPINGRIGFHEGVDIAGKLGSDIAAAAAGVVIYSGKRFKYGNTVEISHGNGYVTRYAHCMENLAKVGDTVKKGEVIARIGSTGRSTGPHVHFEVMENGRLVDPIRFVKADERPGG